MKLRKPRTSFGLAVAAVALLLPLISLAAGSIDSANKYAWGASIGWVNFNPTNGNAAASDAGLSGYVWSENYGWINLSPSSAGVKNDGTGVLSGYAWGENTGYINFSGVRINPQGVFTGTATGDIVGSLTFDCTNCKAATTWRPSTPAATPASGPVGVGYFPPSFTLNGGASSTPVSTVTLTLSTAPGVSLLSLTNESASRSWTATSSYRSAFQWDFCAGLPACPPGAYSVTVRFLDSQNNLIGTVSHSIAYVPTALGVAPTTVSTTTSASSTSIAATSTDLAGRIAALQAQMLALQREAAARRIAATQTASTSSLHFGRDLKLGMTGNDVKRLQVYFISRASGPAGRALKAHGTTNNFATLTLKALIEFQKKAGISPANGYFGPITRAYVNSRAQ
jgi:hypothetical protein